MSDPHPIFQPALEALYAEIEKTPLRPWLSSLPKMIDPQLRPDAHGKMAEWLAAVAALPKVRPNSIEFEARFALELEPPLEIAQKNQLIEQLQTLHPWRKGPFNLFGIHIDTEWRSDWKWERVFPHLSLLENRRILDIGSGNGYYGWRMLAHAPRFVLGLDPFLIYNMQYWAMRHFLDGYPNWVIPLGIEQLPLESRAFDTVFSMGVLYHRRSPMDHLIACRDSLRKSGEFVLETLVIDGKLGETLVPEGRYAQMRNVWFIPSLLTLESWLKKCQFKEIRCVDVTPTRLEEQRTTEWMRFHSLENFLDPRDQHKTIEGYPAPLRATFIAQSP